MKVKKVIKNPAKLLSSLRRGIVGEDINVVGITGTLGKTTVAHMLWHILVENGVKAGLVSSDGVFKLDSKNLEIKANNLEYSQLYKIIDEFISENYELVVVEVTSKSIQRGTFDWVRFDAGIITNIKHHDKDLYANWDEYAQLKLAFINLIKDEGLLIVDSSNEVIDWLEKNEKNILSNILLYISGDNYQQNSDSTFEIEKNTYSLDMYSEANIKNAIQAIKMAHRYIQHKDHFINEVKNFKFPKGRQELLKSNEISIVVDGARRKDEVTYSLVELKKKLSSEQQIIAVIGAEGSIDPDRKKVGLAALHVADKVILCPTDPRKEDVEDINNAMIALMEKDGGVVVERYLSEEEFKMSNKESLKIRIKRVIKNGSVPVICFDENNYSARIDAIELALTLANPGDLVYIGGKGNDDVMIFDGVEYEWSDHEALQIAMDRLGIL
jgi:UDP-N-acetylmuramoyl-L-alanyl-D-glutamate--2,6-diaminopimelate ligase